MRRESLSFEEAPTRKDAARLCPWAARIIEVDGGWMCFESVDDFKTWSRQT
jgi:hypothetical protein